MITQEDIERLGKAQAAAGAAAMQFFTENMQRNTELFATQYAKAMDNYKAASDAWMKAAREFAQQKKDKQS